MTRTTRDLRSRVLLLFAGVGVLFGCLTVRLWYLQIVRGAAYRALADQNRLRTIHDTPAPRGLICDRRGRVLVGSRQRQSLALIPEEVGRHPEVLKRVADILGEPVAAVKERLQKRAFRPYVPVSIAEGIDLQTVCVTQENRTRLPGAVVRSDPVRFYRYGSHAAHVLGYIGEIDAEELESARLDPRFQPGSLTGKTGIEKAYDWYLVGRQGQEELEVDAHGRVRQKLGVRSGTPGSTLILTLDSNLQRLCEQQLEASGHSGAIVVMNVRSGEVLALASYPAYNPNLFSGATTPMTPAEWDRLRNDPRNPLHNRALASRYPPGSTFKLVTAAAAWTYHEIDPQTTFVCTGGKKIGDRVFGCWKEGGHGRVNLRQALAESCDVYFYNAGLQVGVSRLARVMRRFGIGQRTGIDLPAESAGILPTPVWKKRVIGERWYMGDTANLSIGQGAVATTPLQMCRVAAAVANGGRLVVPHLVRKIVTMDKEVHRPPTPKAPTVGLDSRCLRALREGMRGAVIDDHGTAKILRGLPVHVAAKTGTAETRRDQEPHAWLVTFAPYESPQIAMTIVCEHAGHGSEVAGPIARALHEYLFNDDGRLLIAAAGPNQ